MLTAGTETAEAPKPNPQSVAKPPGGEENGKWEVSDETSPIDGSRTIVLSLPAEQSIASLVGAEKFPRLFIRCKSHQTDTYIHTGSLPFDADRGGKYSVRLRLDDGEPITQFWGPSTSHDSLFAPNPVEFAKLLAASRKLAFEFTPLGSGPVATWFDLTSLEEPLGRIAEACGWSGQGGSPEGAALDLHTIRRVLLEANFASDPNRQHKVIEVVEKHTCLQVVDSPRAADAALSWEVGSGASLKLISKDGHVLWSKKGFTPPFGALNDTLGCPHEGR